MCGRKVYHISSKHQKAGGTILISDKEGLKTKNTSRDKEEHFKMVEESTHKTYKCIYV